MAAGHGVDSDRVGRIIADPGAATEPTFNFTGPSETFIDDPGIASRWQAQIGLRYYFE